MPTHRTAPTPSRTPSLPFPGRRRWPVAAAGAAVLALVVAAVVSPGFAATSVASPSETVWVTDAGHGSVGRLNRQIQEINSQARLGQNQDVDVFQDQAAVIARTGTVLRPVDPVTVTLGERISLPASADIGYGAGILAIADSASGSLWTGSPDELVSLDPTSTAPRQQTAAGVKVAVSNSGVVFAVAPGSDALWSVSRAGVVSVGRLPGGPLSDGSASDGSPVQIAVVGDAAVVLDVQRRDVVVGDHRTPIPGSGAVRLQQSGQASQNAVVATTDGLYSVPLSGGSANLVATIEGSGSPTSPVQLDGCIHGAWAGTGSASTYAVRCGNGTPSTVGFPGDGDLRFRVNGSVIVLNDLRSGNVWLLDENMTLISNWTTPASIPKTQNGDNGTTDVGQQQAPDPIDCATATDPAPPTPVADDYRVRPGRSTVLPVLDNDVLAPCSAVLVGGTQWPTHDDWVHLVDGGRAIQVDLPADVTAQALPPLAYWLDDGRSQSETIPVAVTVIPADAPAEVEVVRSDPVVYLEDGGSSTVDVFDFFRSPTGDQLALESATDSSGATVSFRPDGHVTVSDTGPGAGDTRRVIDLTVSAGGSDPKTARLTVVVDDQEKTPISAAPVAVAGRVGVPVVARPLAAVQSGAVEPVRLKQVSPRSAAGATASIRDDGTVVLAATEAGVHTFTYTVAAGDKQTAGVLRFDVFDSDPAAAPRAMLDVVYLPSGGAVTVEPTANDRDPAGNGLALVAVDRARSPDLSLVEHDMRSLRITARQALAGPTTVSYTVSNGRSTAQGQVLVIPVAPLIAPSPPTAQPIRVAVRAGDAVTIPVDRYASDPDGDELTVQVDPTASVPGTLFTSGTRIRYLAPATAPTGDVTFAYTVMNGQRRTSAAAPVTITVVPNGDANQAPSAPAPVVTAVTTGQSVHVPLPLQTLDPDGDWVTVQAVRAGDLGSSVLAGTDSLDYTAGGQSGIDRIRYTATDPRGASVEGLVTVIVVPEQDTVEPPNAPDLVATVRPGRTVGVDVLSAVTGRKVTFGDPAVDTATGWPVTTDRSNLVVTAPDQDGAVGTVRYHVVDDRGLTATGRVIVTVSATAPIRPPRADDILVTPAMVATDISASVDTTTSLHSTSGSADQLILVLPDGSPVTVDGTRTLRVPLTAGRQVLAYGVKDDQASGQGFVVVPPAEQLLDFPPRPAPDAPSISVQAGSAATIRLADQVQVAAGRTATVGRDPSASTRRGSVSQIDDRTVRYTAGAGSAGTDAVVIPVTDGRSSADITVPVTITPAPGAAFTLRNARIDVAVGSSAQLDLSRLLDPADTTGVSFSADPVDGLGVSTDGPVLTVTADSQTAQATKDVVVHARDEAGQDQATVTVTVVATLSPPPLVASVTVNGAAGQPTRVDVLTGATPDGLTLVDQVSRPIQGDASVEWSGSTLVVTPAGAATGSVVVPFTAADGQGRRAGGQVTVVVSGNRPSTPSTPSEVSGTRSADSVSMSWSTSDDPATIDHYELSAEGVTRSCPTTTCVVSGLAPATYTFQVIAVDVQGRQSDPSGRSVGVTITGASVGPAPTTVPSPTTDTPTPTPAPAPGPTTPTPTLSPTPTPTTPTTPAPPAWATPQAPTVGQRDSGTLVVSWVLPTSGSPALVGVNVQQSPGGSVVTLGATAASRVFSSLDPAVGYSFQVQWVGDNGLRSEWSPLSAAVRPVAPTLPPGAPQLSLAAFDARGSTSSGAITATWSAPPERGSSITGYTLQLDGGSQLQLGAGETSYSFSGVGTGSHSVSVLANSDAGPGERASATATVGKSTWAAPEGLTVTPDTNSLFLSWVDASVPGTPGTWYQWRVAGSEWSVMSEGHSQSSATIGGLQPGREYTVQVRECSPKNVPSGFTVPCSDIAQQTVTTSTAAVMSPIQVRTDVTPGKSATFSWNASQYANGAGIASVEATVDDVTQSVSADGTGSVTTDLAYYQHRVFSIRVTSTDGRVVTGAAEADGGNDPNRTLRMVKTADGLVLQGSGWGPFAARPLSIWVDCTTKDPASNQACTNSTGVAGSGLWYNQKFQSSADGTVSRPVDAPFPGLVWAVYEDGETNRVDS